MEAEIELNRRIVAAAERLASDRSANKSVRKKRRKDLQAATLRLRGLEKGGRNGIKQWHAIFYQVFTACDYPAPNLTFHR